MKSVLLILLDSVGIGALPDAADYNDLGAATVQHTLDHNPGLRLPNLEKLGLFQIEGLERYATGVTPIGKYGKCLELSKGKDSIVGHWEVMGVPTDRAFDTFPQGFPADIIDGFSAAIGREVLGNEVASGTEIIARLGQAHMGTGNPIVYTSADSVFQIACHEEIVDVPTLYRWCESAQQVLEDLGYRVGRVIARPFVGTPGNFTRTANRHDYAAAPPKKTFLETLTEAGVPIHSIGKPVDIFPTSTFASAVKTASNSEGMAKALEAVREKEGLIFVNLLDFDQKWGHRRDAESYGRGLKEFDDFLGALLETLGEDTLLIVTADHGCDPTHHGTDHTREYIPLLIWRRGITPEDLGVLESFSAVAKAAVEGLMGPEKYELG